MGYNLNDDDLTIDEQCEISQSLFEALEKSGAPCGSPEEVNESEDDLSVYNEILRKNEGNHEHAIFEFCFKKNICYDSDIVKSLLKNKEDDILCRMPGAYLDIVKSNPKYAGITFFSQIRQENFEKIYSDVKYLSELNEEDRKNRQVVIDVFSYDPFKTEVENRSQLYRDLAGMTTESMRKDIAKQKAALSIVRSYSNIENYQKKVTDITVNGDADEETQEKLTQYLKIISNIQSTINQTAEKNNFTVKGIGSNGKGMLSDVINQVEEMGIDEGITNFYDIDTSKSIEEVANISFKAQLNQVNLSKTDYADILNQQCNIVKEAQRTAKDALEACRLAKEKIAKQELIEELTIDYKKKGISEEEIEEFISREYHLYDGTE